MPTRACAPTKPTSSESGLIITLLTGRVFSHPCCRTYVYAWCEATLLPLLPLPERPWPNGSPHGRSQGYRGPEKVNPQRGSRPMRDGLPSECPPLKDARRAARAQRPQGPCLSAGTPPQRDELVRGQLRGKRFPLASAMTKRDLPAVTPTGSERGQTTKQHHPPDDTGRCWMAA